MLMNKVGILTLRDRWNIYDLVWLNLMLGLVVFSSPTVLASPIKSDRSLKRPSQVQTVQNQGRRTVSITGGTQTGPNLFHSFTEFSVLNRQTASFQKIKPSVKNIFTRVTGKSPSIVNGAIELLNNQGQASSANFVLMNPQGIQFQAGASIQQLQGSFMSTTGNNIAFSDGGLFPANSLVPTTVLSAGMPQSIQTGVRPGAIQLNRTSQLQPSPGESLLLIGGEVTFSGTSLFSTDSRFDIAGVGANQSISLLNEPVPRLKRPTHQILADVRLTDGSSITLEGLNASQHAGLFIAGDRVVFENNSSLISTLNAGAPQAWPIDIQAQQLNILDTAFIFSNNFSDRTGAPIVLRTENLRIDCALVIDNCAIVISNSGGTGRAGNIRVTAQDLKLLNGGEIVSLASLGGAGSPGNIRVDGTSLTVDGGFILDGDWRASGIISENRTDTLINQGIPSAIDIRAKSLRLQKGGIISSATLNANPAGNINVTAQSLDISGNALNPDGSLVPGTQSLPNLPISSGLFTSVDPGASGAGGTLTVRARSLTVRDGGKLQAATFGSGQAGEIKVLGDTVSIAGEDIEGQFPSSIFAGSGGIPGLIVGNPQATGAGNDVTIRANTLLISDQGAIAVGSLNADNQERQGVGNINIMAKNIRLDQAGQLLSNTASGNGGNITVDGFPNDSKAQMLLILDSSQISTTAGLDQAQGSGGNITLNVENMIANQDFRPNVNGNDITSKTFSDTGGNIEINADLLLGIRPGVAMNGNQQNDIDVSPESTLGTPGTINIAATLVDPTQQLVSLPEGTRIPRVARACDRQVVSAPSRLVDSGRGGLTKSPSSHAQVNHAWEDLRWADRATQRLFVGRSTAANVESRFPKSVHEAQGLMRADSGQLLLVAQVPPQVQSFGRVASQPCWSANS